MSDRYEGFIFDIDGTLLDSNFLSLKSLQDTLLKVENKYYSIEELKIVIGLSDYDTFKLLDVVYIDECYLMWKELSSQVEAQKTFFKDIPLVLNNLKQVNLKLGIVTSREYEHYKRSIIYKQLHHLFDAIITSDDTLNHKPHPEPIKKWLNTTQSNAERIIYIGDTNYDYLCAKNAGVDFGLAAWGCHKDFYCDIKLNKPKDILQLID